MKMKKSFGITIAVAALFALNACSTVEDVISDGGKVDYRSGSDNLNRNSLEVPPDLTQPNSAQNRFQGVQNPSAVNTLTSQQILVAQSKTILPATGNYVKLVQDGNERWLLVKAPVEKVWPQIREFWLNQGFILEIDNPNIGIIETDWLENRAKLPQNWVRKTLSKVLDPISSTGQMDKFRIRVERGADNTTEIYLSHRGMTEVFKNSGRAEGRATSNQLAQTVWTPRQPDPELEAEMLNLILQQLGVKAEVAKATIANPEVRNTHARLVDFQQGKAIELDDNIDRAWRRVGLALDRSGYIVIDRNRKEGIYYVRQADENYKKEEKPGVIASLFGKKKIEKKSAETSHNTLPAQLKVHVAHEKIFTFLYITPATNSDREININALLEQLLNELK